jgi:predicted DNA-binding transcriptional regulator AlpA
MARPERRTTTGDDRVFLPASQVWGRYGVSEMSINRWLRNPKLNFPKPIYIGRFRYWRLSDLTRWERERAAGSGRAA